MTTKHKYILIFIFFATIFISCTNNKSDNNKTHTDYDTTHPRPVVEKQFLDGEKKLSFKNISDIVSDKKSYAWVNINPQDNSSSLSLHFNLETIDTIAMAYSSECWLMFPIKVSSDKIIVYWDVLIDTKYDFDIVKVMNKIETAPGKPFMELKLLNDSTLNVSYLIPDITHKLNSASKDRVLFPEKFTVCKTCF